MGVIYKLHPKVRDFILQSKRLDPNLSCRGISALISDQFQINLSKSRVNFVIKHAGLSMPVGRRKKFKRNLIESDGLGVILLKSADYLLRGCAYLAQTIKSNLSLEVADLTEKIEYQLYCSLFDLSDKNKSQNLDFGLWSLIGKKLSDEDISSYLSILQQVKLDYVGAQQKIADLFKEIRTIRLNLSNNSALFLDGQFHTVWSRSQIPNDFSASNYITKCYINKCFLEEKPLVIMSAPGYEAPSKEFFDFLHCSERMGNKVVNINFYDNQLAEVGSLNLESGKKIDYVFGLWPWQYGKHRNVRILDEFRQFYFEQQRKDYYIASAEVELLQPITNQSVTLKGCALKPGKDEKIKLIILSNLSLEKNGLDYVISLYLNIWPNLDEGFQDLSRKIELFTYSASQTHPSLITCQDFDKNVQDNLSVLPEQYLKALDEYVRLRFFPQHYAKKSLQDMKELFYCLKVRIKIKKRYSEAFFLIPPDYPNSKDLDYACRRLNEFDVCLFNGKKLWFNIERTQN